MPRFTVSINQDFTATRLTPRVGQTGRRVRDLDALIERNEPGREFLSLQRAFLFLLSHLLVLAIWLGCFALGAAAFTVWRF